MPPPQPWGHHQGLPPNAGGPGYGGNPQFLPPRPHDNFYPPSDLGPMEKQPHHGISAFGRDVPPMGVNQQPPPMISQVHLMMFMNLNCKITLNIARIDCSS